MTLVYFSTKDREDQLKKMKTQEKQELLKKYDKKEQRCNALIGIFAIFFVPLVATLIMGVFIVVLIVLPKTNSFNYYKVIINVTSDNSSKVGHDWVYNFSLNDEKIKSGQTVKIDKNTSVVIKTRFLEVDDVQNDIGDKQTILGYLDEEEIIKDVVLSVREDYGKSKGKTCTFHVNYKFIKTTTFPNATEIPHTISNIVRIVIISWIFVIISAIIFISILCKIYYHKKYRNLANDE